MTLECLQNDMKQAMKIGDTELRDIMRSVIGAVKKAAIDERCEITEELVDRVLLKEAKIIQEQIDTCPKDRVETLEIYNRKLAKLKCYLPQLLDNPIDIETKIRLMLLPSGIELVKANKGIIMKIVMPQFKGKADMKVVNQVIGELLV
jgi:uncharacterized protein YqeY